MGKPSQKKSTKAGAAESLLRSPALLQSRFIQLRNSEGMHNVRLSDIIFLSSDNSLTFFNVMTDMRIIVSQPLGFYEKALGGYGFCRVHRRYIINLAQLRHCRTGDDGYMAELAQGSRVPVSRQHKKELTEALMPISVISSHRMNC